MLRLAKGADLRMTIADRLADLKFGHYRKDGRAARLRRQALRRRGRRD